MCKLLHMLFSPTCRAPGRKPSTVFHMAKLKFCSAQDMWRHLEGPCYITQAEASGHQDCTVSPSPSSAGFLLCTSGRVPSLLPGSARMS